MGRALSTLIVTPTSIRGEDEYYWLLHVENTSTQVD